VQKHLADTWLGRVSPATISRKTVRKIIEKQHPPPPSPHAAHGGQSSGISGEMRGGKGKQAEAGGERKEKMRWYKRCTRPSSITRRPATSPPDHHPRIGDVGVRTPPTHRRHLNVVVLIIVVSHPSHGAHSRTHLCARHESIAACWLGSPMRAHPHPSAPPPPPLPPKHLIHRIIPPHPPHSTPYITPAPARGIGPTIISSCQGGQRWRNGDAQEAHTAKWAPKAGKGGCV
jgi:hypothetical protein